MGQTELSGLWEGLRQLVGRLKAGRYWTERRDACEELQKVTRQGIFRLRQAAEDADPDVSHWGRHACLEIEKDLTAPLEGAAHKADTELAEGGFEAGTAPLPTPDAEGGVADGEARMSSPEAVMGWLEDYAAGKGISFTRKHFGGSLLFPLADQRKQTIYVDLSRKDKDEQPLALFYSLCGEVRPEALDWAMQANCNLSAGAFGVIQHKERSMLIMMMRWSLPELSINSLGPRLQYLAVTADWAEARFQAQDEH
jgi:hypothetical protein